ncbi:protein GRAVITROPIC IN THE LIGHT 1-like [Nicotiana tabacum]|nr:PREDICTED: uncharacterized protein LOC104227550 [Nicotiana sylvestris]
MDSKNRSALSKSRLARTLAKVLHIRAVTGGNRKPKSQDKFKNEAVKNDVLNKGQLNSFVDKDEKLKKRAATEAFLANLFASISAVKSAYAELQFAQSPYDPEFIQSADEVIVSELKSLSELKHCYLTKQFDEYYSLETTLVLAEIKEQKSILKTYYIMGKKLDSQLKLILSEITFLRETLNEANKENKLLEKRLMREQVSDLDNLQLTKLSPSHFIMFLQQTIRSIRSFVMLLCREMEYAGWDLDAAALSIQPGIMFLKSSDKCYAFESFVCREMFDGFNHPQFLISKESTTEEKKQQRLFFNRFLKLRSANVADYLAWKPKSAFARFCCAKYLKLVHPKMESSLFGDLDHRNLLSSGEYPDTTFFSTFAEMAKRIWLLQCLAFSFDPEVAMFQVSSECRFSDVYMESVNEEAFLMSSGSPETEPRVGFPMVPGFMVGKTVIQCQVYLC